MNSCGIHIEEQIIALNVKKPYSLSVLWSTICIVLTIVLAVLRAFSIKSSFCGGKTSQSTTTNAFL